MNKIIFIFSLSLWMMACQDAPPADTQNSSPAPALQSPDQTYGALFEAVQMAKVFPDGKTFADCTPKFAPEEIMKRYQEAKDQSGFDLNKFILEHFAPPVKMTSGFVSDVNRLPSDHIRALWPVLMRKGDGPQPAGSTLIPLPNPYIVPGGRFGEVYYWDSYFTMLGLKADGKDEVIGSMLDNFAYLINTVGHIPNGNRTYYLSRSQPPFFSLMVQLAGKEDKYLSEMEKEYAFWMDGAESVSSDKPAHRRVVWIDDETVLNRYWDDRPSPRPESYKEDRASSDAGFAADRPKDNTYVNIKAGAESGWDFSSRWGVSDHLLQGINTVDIIPIDLNCLLWQMEKTLAENYTRKNDQQKAQFYGKRAYFRERALQKYCWNSAAGWYEDFDWTNRAQTGVISAAGMFPLFVKLANQQQAEACAKTLQAKLLKPGGIVTTVNHTGQQWDAPNGWAPLQWVSIVGLRNYQQNALANDVKNRWVRLCTDVYRRTGKMLEKYNVEDLSLEAGGGEYPVQDGFGWTNGVLQALLSETP